MESVLEQPVAPLSSTNQLDQTSIHLLPCEIQHDGRANISGFFFLVDGQYPSVLAAESSDTSVSSSSAAAAAVTAVENLRITPTTTEVTSENGTDTTSTVNAVSSEKAPEVSFRGRTLKGTVVSVPEGYVGTVYKSFDPLPQDNNSNTRGNPAGTMDEDQEYEAMLKGMQEERKTLKTQAQFKEFMMWGHDEQPTLKTEKVLRAMQWFDIAKVLHEPLC
ncbi:MAG: ribonuclease H2, subunit C [Benniella sp.]|nr:MAG: ribonuclease H2, subunit C [Benniella sp.]